MCIADDANMRPKYQRNDAHILWSSICIISKYSILGTTEFVKKLALVGLNSLRIGTL